MRRAMGIMIGLGLGLAFPAGAMTPADLADERTSLMKEMSGALRLVASAASEVLPLDDEVARSAHLLHDHSQSLLGLFPTEVPESGGSALPQIWTDRANFEDLANRFQAAAARLDAAAAARNEVAFKDAFQATAGGCLACHDTFRKPKT